MYRPRAPMKFLCFSGEPNFYKSNTQGIFAPRNNSSAQIERYSPEPKIRSKRFCFYFIFTALMRYSYFALYNIEVANAMTERCKESTFVGKESRFFTMVFLSTSFSLRRFILVRYYFLKASKLDKAIMGVDHPDHF